ncbi:MAG TPA: hypothetical protein VN634_19675 [Candidatus Limnocylindrales bacterium]|nr:hypothetical protein [Candidatus Limnocylindrales bacterium]
MAKRTPPEPRPPLKEQIKRELAVARWTQEDFCSNEKLKLSAFREQLSRNRYSESTLRAVAVLLGVNEAQLETDFRFEKTGERSLVENPRLIVERDAEKDPRKRSLTISRSVEFLYSSLNRDDLVVVFSLAEPPLECTREGWSAIGAVLAAALQRGARLLHVRPSRSTVRTFLSAMPDYPEFDPDEQFKILQRNLKAAGSGEAMANCVLWRPDYCPLWCLGLRFGYYATGRFPRREYKLFAKFPSTLGSSRGGEILLPTDGANLAQHCHTYLTHAFRTEPSLHQLQPLLESRAALDD